MYGLNGVKLAVGNGLQHEGDRKWKYKMYDTTIWKVIASRQGRIERKTLMFIRTTYPMHWPVETYI